MAAEVLRAPGTGPAMGALEGPGGERAGWWGLPGGRWGCGEGRAAAVDLGRSGVLRGGAKRSGGGSEGCPSLLWLTLPVRVARLETPSLACSSPPTSVATFSRLCLPRAFFLPWAFEHTHPSSGCVFPPCPPVTLSPPVTFAVLWDTGHCYLPFRYQMGQVTCPRSHSRCALGLGFDPPPPGTCVPRRPAH